MVILLCIRKGIISIYNYFLIEVARLSKPSVFVVVVTLLFEKQHVL